MIKLPQKIYSFNAIALTIPTGFFEDIGKMFLKWIWNDKNYFKFFGKEQYGWRSHNTQC